MNDFEDPPKSKKSTQEDILSLFKKGDIFSIRQLHELYYKKFNKRMPLDTMTRSLFALKNKRRLMSPKYAFYRRPITKFGVSYKQPDDLSSVCCGQAISILEIRMPNRKRCWICKKCGNECDAKL